MIVNVYRILPEKRSWEVRFLYSLPETEKENKMYVLTVGDDISEHLARVFLNNPPLLYQIEVECLTDYRLDTIRTMQFNRMINKVKKEFDKSELIWYDQLIGRKKQ